MAWELIYASSATGVRSSGEGYCTVSCTRGMGPICGFAGIAQCALAVFLRRCARETNRRSISCEGDARGAVLHLVGSVAYVAPNRLGQPGRFARHYALTAREPRRCRRDRRSCWRRGTVTRQPAERRNCGNASCALPADASGGTGCLGGNRLSRWRARISAGFFHQPSNRSMCFTIRAAAIAAASGCRVDCRIAEEKRWISLTTLYGRSMNRDGMFSAILRVGVGAGRGGVRINGAGGGSCRRNGASSTSHCLEAVMSRQTRPILRR